MTTKNVAGSTPATSNTSAPGPWETMALAQLREWDPAWAEAAERVTLNPWKHEVLPRKTVELIGLAVNAACTNLNPEGTRRHIRAALDAGASRDEILTVLKMASFLSHPHMQLRRSDPPGGSQGGRCTSDGTFETRHAGLRQGARERRVERGMDTVLQPRPGMDGAIHGGGHPHL